MAMICVNNRSECNGCMCCQAEEVEKRGSGKRKLVIGNEYWDVKRFAYKKKY